MVTCIHAGCASSAGSAAGGPCPGSAGGPRPGSGASVLILDRFRDPADLGVPVSCRGSLLCSRDLVEAPNSVLVRPKPWAPRCPLAGTEEGRTGSCRSVFGPRRTPAPGRGLPPPCSQTPDQCVFKGTANVCLHPGERKYYGPQQSSHRARVQGGRRRELSVSSLTAAPCSRGHTATPLSCCDLWSQVGTPRVPDKHIPYLGPWTLVPGAK